MGSAHSPPHAVETPDRELGNLSLSEAAAEEEVEEVGDWDAATQYPQRPGEPDCAYYLRTGRCGYGSVCKFNHPPDKSNRAVKVKDYNEFPERMTPLRECKFYLMPGGCKYGKACKYRHYREKTKVKPVEVNFLLLPVRPGEKECPHYMRTGTCMLSTNCLFHHPVSVTEAVGDASSGWENDRNPEHIIGASQLRDSSSPSQRNSIKSNSWLNATSQSFIPGSVLPHQVLHPNREYSASQAPETRTSLQSGRQCASASILNGAAANTLDPVKQQAQVKNYPERPGEPECPFFMRCGDCKFKSECKFHHPKMRLLGLPTCDLTPMGLPLRPDQPICTFYNRFGICKYGPACKFDHPTDFGSSSPSSKSSAQNSSPDNKTLDSKIPGINASVQQPV